MIVRRWMTAGALVLAGCLVAAGPHVWNLGPALLEPGPPGSFDSVAVKDPSIVQHEGQWHLFYTARNTTDYTLAYASAERLTGLQTAERFPLTQLHASKGKYAAAPQVFYFRQQKKWYLIFQTNDANYLPVYSTTSHVGQPKSWTEPKPLLAKSERAKWIDFWVICDERKAYLFFTRDHKEVVVMSTRIEDFPSGFGSPRVVFAPVHEAVHVYRVQGTSPPEYALLYEQQHAQDRRSFGWARASSLDGAWHVSDDHFAGPDQLAGKPGERWTDEVSHGELLRSGSDELLEIPDDRWDFLIQGMQREAHVGDYPLLPWGLDCSPGYGANHP
jgi:hypothetical protein